MFDWSEWKAGFVNGFCLVFTGGGLGGGLF